jgi:hypothetical protein
VQQLVYSKWPWPHTSFPATSLLPPPPMSASAIDTLRRVCCEQERERAHLDHHSLNALHVRRSIRNAHSQREKDENRTEAKGKTLPGQCFIVLRTL